MQTHTHNTNVEPLSKNTAKKSDARGERSKRKREREREIGEDKIGG